jgi:hypothetical protein
MGVAPVALGDCLDWLGACVHDPSTIGPLKGGCVESLESLRHFAGMRR